MLKKFKWNVKGQASFELLLATAFIMIVSLIVISLWVNVNEDTFILAKVKTKVTGILSESNELYILKKAEIDSSTTKSNLVLNLYFVPTDFSSNPEVSILKSKIVNDLSSEIANSSKYGSVTIKIV